MAFYDFNWTPQNEQKIADHGISKDEFEEVVREPYDTGIRRSRGLPIAFGETSTGRFIAAVYELHDDGITVIPITAWEHELNE